MGQELLPAGLAEGTVFDLFLVGLTKTVPVVDPWATLFSLFGVLDGFVVVGTESLVESFEGITEGLLPETKLVGDSTLTDTLS